MGYKILNIDSLSLGDYGIMPIRDEDKFVIMDWRNAQLDILRQQGRLTREMQADYFKNVVSKDFNVDQPKQILVSFFLSKVLIGYGGLVHIDWANNRSEVSFLLETERNRDIPLFKKEYSIFLELIKKVAFDYLNLNKLTTEAFDLRPYLIETLEANEFVLEGRLRAHNLINGNYIDSYLHACFRH